jgi:hypothetical protein
MFWPGVDRWPPTKWVWISALLVATVALILVLFGGVVGAVIYIVILIVCLVLGANQRLKNLGAEEFWNSRPKDE